MIRVFIIKQKLKISNPTICIKIRVNLYTTTTSIRKFIICGNND